MKIAFFGTPKFAEIILRALHQEFPVSLVITQPDRPAGRKQTLTPSPVKLFAQRDKIPTFTFTSIIRINEVLQKIKPDFILVAAYGPPFFNKETLKIPKYGCFNIHPSLLPKYRGASPVQFALLNSEKQTGVTIFKMTEKIDKGPIIAQESMFISPNDNNKTLTEKLAYLGAKLLLKTLNLLIFNRRPSIKYMQNHSQATYARRLKKEDGFISFESIKKILQEKQLKFAEFPLFFQEQIKKNNLAIEQFGNITMNNFIRALYPWPSVWTVLPNKKRLKLLKSRLDKGKIYLDEIQLEGRKKSADTKFLLNLFLFLRSLC